MWNNCSGKGHERENIGRKIEIPLHFSPQIYDSNTTFDIFIAVVFELKFYVRFCEGKRKIIGKN